MSGWHCLIQLSASAAFQGSEEADCVIVEGIGRPHELIAWEEILSAR